MAQMTDQFLASVFSQRAFSIDMPGYDALLICESGHIVNSRWSTQAAHNRPFCETCGANTMHQCPSCSNPIPGAYFNVGPRRWTSRTTRPNYCAFCSELFPWTRDAIEAALDLSSATDGNRRQIEADFRELTRNTPKAQASAVRVIQLIDNAPEMAKKLLYDIVIALAAGSAAAEIRRQIGM